MILKARALATLLVSVALLPEWLRIVTYDDAEEMAKTKWEGENLAKQRKTQRIWRKFGLWISEKRETKNCHHLAALLHATCKCTYRASRWRRGLKNKNEYRWNEAPRAWARAKTMNASKIEFECWTCRERDLVEIRHRTRRKNCKELQRTPQLQRTKFRTRSFPVRPGWWQQMTGKAFHRLLVIVDREATRATRRSLIAT